METERKRYTRSDKVIDAALIGWTIVCVVLLVTVIYVHPPHMWQAIGNLTVGITAMVGVYIYRRIIRRGKL